MRGPGRGDADVLCDAHPVSEALRPDIQRLPDALHAVGLARVHGDVRTRLADQAECRCQPQRREPGLGPGDVEPDHAVVNMPLQHPCDIVGAVGLPHRADDEPGSDVVALGARHPLALTEPCEHRRHGVVHRLPLVLAQLRGHPDLGPAHPVSREVDHRLGGNPLQRRGCLQHSDGVGECLQELLQRAGVGSLHEPAREVVGVGGGQPGVAALASEVDDRCRPQPAVEVVVQVDQWRKLEPGRLRRSGHGAGAAVAAAGWCAHSPRPGR